mmetsp:Transcript_92043/g.134518  ORF Transcript_92043/g.134518 Transcript_92043/m.134518 type:complete len:215 (-) Transcript_92043:716-1360(-)
MTVDFVGGKIALQALERRLTFDDEPDDHRQRVERETHHVEEGQRCKRRAGLQLIAAIHIEGKGDERHQHGRASPQENRGDAPHCVFPDQRNLTVTDFIHLAHEATLPCKVFDYTNALQDFVHDIGALVLDRHDLLVERLLLLRNPRVDGDEHNHERKPSEHCSAYNIVEQRRRHNKLKRRTPKEMEVGRRIAEALRIHRHELHHFSKLIALQAL